MTSTKTAPLNIFVVEDEMLLVMDLEGMIEDAGHNFLGSAASYGDAMGHGDLDRADLVLVDIQIRGERTGLDVARAVRTKHDPLIVFTTANARLVPDDMGAGDALLAKPVQETMFVQALAFLQAGERTGVLPDQVPNDLVISERLKARWRFIAGKPD